MVFAVLEANQVRFTALDKWRPETLPEPTNGRAVSHGEALFRIVVSISFVLWWTGLVELHALNTHAGMLFDLAPAPIWARMYLPILACSIADIGLAFVNDGSLSAVFGGLRPASRASHNGGSVNATER